MSEKKESKIRQELRGDLKVVTDFMPRVTEFLKKHQKKLIIIGVIGAVVGAIATYEMIHLTSVPEFCNLFCHEMTPEVESWERSQHAQRGIDCKECHYGEGVMGVVLAKYYAQYQLLHHITGSYSNHPLEEAKEHGFELAEQNIHMKGNQVYYMKAHGYALDVINYNCKRCHTNVFDIERSSGRSVKMAHKQHMEKGFECTDCHINIVHGTDPEGYNLPTMWTCFKCHNDEKAPRTECTLCHVGQKEMWDGVGAKDVDDEAAMMLGEVDCIECHLEEDDYVPPSGAQVCVDCHGEDSYAQDMKDWQDEVRKKSLTLRNILDELAQRMKDISESGKKVADYEEAKELYSKARYNANAVEHDGSKGVHNYDYAVSILDASLKMARDARGILTAERQ